MLAIANVFACISEWFQGAFSTFLSLTSQQGYHFIAVEMFPFIFCDVILHSPNRSCV